MGAVGFFQDHTYENMKHSQKYYIAVFLFFSTLSATTLHAQEPASDMPMGQSSSGSPSLLPEEDSGSWLDEDLFGVKGGGYLHPYLAIGAEYTDNLFNLNVDEQSNFLTTISPGFWLSLPSRKEIPLDIAPNNTSAGGLQAALDEFTTFDRMNIYLLGGITYKIYSADSDLDDYDARLEGLFKYNLRSGLSFEIIDRFTHDQDRFDVGQSTAESVRKYNSNLFLTDVDWNITEKFRTKLEYSNFLLDYDEREDEWLSRVDNGISWSGYYNYSPKTALFMEYRFVDVAYDTDTFKDSEHHYLFGGINWSSTEKTAFRFKAGYQKRNYDNELLNDAIDASRDGDNDSLALQLALDYHFSEKTQFIVSLNHNIEETDSFGALDRKVLAGTLQYRQELSERLIGTCDFRYESADYTQIIGPDRDDDRYVLRPALQYIFKEWFMVELSYTYDTRSSTDDYYDYNTNTVSLMFNSTL